jgi:hypothetical protein
MDGTAMVDYRTKSELDALMHMSDRGVMPRMSRVPITGTVSALLADKDELWLIFENSHFGIEFRDTESAVGFLCDNIPSLDRDAVMLSLMI